MTALIQFVARECYWRVESFDWRAIHRTYHTCTLNKDGAPFVALIGADAPIMALAHARDDGFWSFFDEASVASALNGYYGQSIQMLAASDLSGDLSTQDRTWLAALGEPMRYNLRYWTPRTIGQVVFNFWD